MDMHGYFTADMFRPRMQLDWVIRFSCAAHRNFPFISFFKDSHCNRFSIGLSNLWDDTIVSAKMNQETGNYDLSELRSIQDWFLKFELQTVPGVAEIASVGGMVRQYQVIVDPEKLRAFKIPLSRLSKASGSCIGAAIAPAFRSAREREGTGLRLRVTVPAARVFPFTRGRKPAAFHRAASACAYTPRLAPANRRSNRGG